MYVLDTDHLSIIQRRTEPEFGNLAMAITQFPPTDFYASIVSFHEQVLGWNAYIQKAKSAERIVHGYAMLKLFSRVFPQCNCCRSTTTQWTASRRYAHRG